MKMEMKKDELKPLDLEKLADEIIRVEYPTYEQTTILQMKNAIIRKKQLIKQILEQHIELAVKGILLDINTSLWLENKQKVRLTDLIIGWFPDVVENEEEKN